MIALARLDGLILDGKRFVESVPLAEFSKILGYPTRTIDPGPPAPYGHRNNHIHLYDHLGLYLNEDHATRLIGEVTFALDPMESPFQVEHPISGELWVGDTKVYLGMRERDYSNPASVVFHSHVSGFWTAEGDHLAISMMTQGRRNRTGRRSKSRHIVSVSVGFKNSHHLEMRAYTLA